MSNYNRRELDIEKQNWPLRIASTPCHITPVRKAPCTVDYDWQCHIFFEGVSDKAYPLQVEKRDGYVYALLGTKEAIIVDYESECEHIVFPARIGGRKVLAVSGMNYRMDVKKATVENGILQTCFGFMRGCTNLENVELPSTLVRIARDFCCGSCNIKEFKVDTGSLSLTAEDGILYDNSKKILVHYPPARPDKQFVIPDTVRIICERAFEGVVHLEQVLVPEGMEKIGRFAFMGGPKEVLLPDTVTEIEREAFWASRLESIVIPNSVEHIGERAFRDCTRLKSIKLPFMVDSFGVYMFQECDSLENVWLSEGIRRLEGTFYECRNLKNVYIPASVLEIMESAFDRDDKKMLEGICIYGIEGSQAWNFALEHGYVWRTIEGI